MGHWRALVRLLTPDIATVAGMSSLIVITGLVPLVGPYLIARFIDAAASGTDTGQLTSLAAGYMALAFFGQLLAVVVARMATDLAWKVTNDLRTDLADHVLGLDISFHRGTSPGELVSRVDGDVTALSEFVARFLVKGCAALVTLLGLTVVLGTQDWRIGVGFAVYLSVAVFAVYNLRDFAVDEAAGEQAANGRMYGQIEERLAGADDLRSNGGGSHALASFQVASARVLRSTLLRERQGVGLWIISNFVFVVGGIGALAIDAALLGRGAITIGTAYLIFQYTQIMRRPLDQLADETERVQRAAGGMIRTLELLAERSAISNDGDASLPAGPLSLQMTDLRFEYDDEADPQPVIDGIDLHLSAGRSIGVLGRTGSGKTTLARLILRLVDPTDGTISLGGVPLVDLPIADLRARTGVVSQEVHLFAASIRDNLRLFDESISDDQLQAALGELGLESWVAGLADGLDTMLGPEGSGISAGEGQLVALTRLFLRDPDFVLLDEASSRIDPETERRLSAAIDRLLVGRTALVIAHRLSTIERLDEVLIMSRGTVIEHGETAKLAADPNSRYSDLLAMGSNATIDTIEVSL